MNDKLCIICDQHAGSREHVFPAAFGGRRVNKNIYCGSHNEGFGRHVAALLEQLDIFNALLGVRPDGHDSIRPAPTIADDGSTIMVARGSMELASPPPIDENFAFGERTIQSFSSRRAADRWAGEQRKKGYTVQMGTSSAEVSTFFTEPLHVQKEFGRPDFMRALLYIGLTFVAHHFRAHAKTPGLQAVKGEIQRDDDGPLNVAIWWEPPTALEQLPPSPFALGHCISIAIEETGRVQALISLWGALNFGMVLGEIEKQLITQRVTTFIDPMAERPPNDIQDIRQRGLTLRMGDAEAGRDYIQQVVSGRAPHPMQELLETASAAALRDSATTLHSKLVAANELSKVPRRAAPFEAVSSESARVFSLIQEGIEGFARYEPSLPEPLIAALRLLCKADPNGRRGLSSEAEATLHIVLATLTDVISEHLTANTLGIETVENLIGGGEGVALAFGAVAKPVLLGALREH